MSNDDKKILNQSLRFDLIRDEDETGISGTGRVATGVLFPGGKVALSWLTSTSSLAIYDSIWDVETIHGHGGRTRVEWLDPDPMRILHIQAKLRSNELYIIHLSGRLARGTLSDEERDRVLESIQKSEALQDRLQAEIEGIISKSPY